MQPPPRLRPQLADRPVVRRHRQGDQKEKSDHTNGDVRPLYDVRPNLAEDLHIQHQPDKQMEKDIEERQQAQRPAELSQIHPRPSAQWRHRKNNDQHLQGELAQLVLQRLDRLGPEAARQALI